MIARHRVHRSLPVVAAAKTETVDRLFITEIIPPVSRIYNILVQDETARHGMHKGESSEAGASVFVVKNKMEVKELMCSHCGKTGHDIEACYKLIGYLEGWVYRDQAGRGNGRGRGRGAARGEMLNEDGASVSSPVDHFDDEDDMTAEEQLNRSTRNGRPEETSEASELQTVDLVDHPAVHGQPFERQ
ncbi:unnamed protein product [Cuscuta campestris]|uniref:CCHC-type domain-containing protein n=1 Tax=Cuscuta campestris TaxID=132261 RepID=A0A484L6M9_9ASTE|nr:unnamed protein product [Cuscuta campestris]